MARGRARPKAGNETKAVETAETGERPVNGEWKKNQSSERPSGNRNQSPPSTTGTKAANGTTVEAAEDRLLVNAKMACALLAISARTLWSLTASGEVPHVRIRRSVRYSPTDLAAWIESRKVRRRRA